MEAIKIKEVLNVVKGEILAGDVAEKEILSVQTDSRVNMQSGLFVAIKGENTDGHKYVESAKANGAIAVFVSDQPESFIEDMLYIKVEDTQQALKDLAKWYKSKFNIPFVAVTGSVGKTTTKDMIASVLKTKYNVLKTEGNFNSEIGVPLTLFRLNNAHDIAVIEMGMDRPGQIDAISSMVNPNIAVITNIGTAHIEFLKTRENILKAKCEVFNNLDKNGVAILNRDDDMLQTVTNNFRKIWVGKTNADITVENVRVDYIEGKVISNVCVDNKSYEMYIPGLSEHLVYSALSAIAVGLAYKIDMEDILKGIANYEHTKMRMDIYKLKNNILLIDDTYNANPASMKSVIDTVAKSGRDNKILILGDMFELGEESEKSHINVLEYALKNNISQIVTIGDNMKKAVESIKDKQSTTWYSSKEELYNNLDNILKQNSIIAIKASRGMRLENITEKILERK